MTTDVTTQEVTTQSTAAGGAVELGAASSSREVWRRFAENKLALFGLLLIGILLVTAAFAPLIAPYDPYDQDLANTLAPPSSEHWLGTDPLGRDQLSRLIYGSRIAVVVGLASSPGFNDPRS